MLVEPRGRSDRAVDANGETSSCAANADLITCSFTCTSLEVAQQSDW